MTINNYYIIIQNYVKNKTKNKLRSKKPNKKNTLENSENIKKISKDKEEKDSVILLDEVKSSVQSILHKEETEEKIKKETEEKIKKETEEKIKKEMEEKIKKEKNMMMKVI